jgi:hypothetical protein
MDGWHFSAVPCKSKVLHATLLVLLCGDFSLAAVQISVSGWTESSIPCSYFVYHQFSVSMSPSTTIGAWPTTGAA